MSYRDDALARLDVAAFMAAQGVDLGKKVSGREVRFLCPFHGDTEPSANVNMTNGLWHCKACGAAGGPIDFVMKRQGVDYKTALTEVGRLAGMDPPSLAVSRSNGSAGPAAPAPTSVTKGKLTETNVKAWHEAALRNAELMRWFAEHRGFTDETITTRQLGWDGSRVTIPVRDAAGQLLNVRRYLRNATKDQGKMLPLVPGEAATQLFPLVDPLPPEVLIVEGEWDAMLMHQEGLTQTLTVTAGTGIWKPWMTPLFEGRTVTILPDNDDAGRTGSAKIAAILSNVATIAICQIPNLPAKGDVTDFFVEQQRSADELRALIADATPYVVAPSHVDEGEALRTPLHRASDAALRGRRLELPVLLSGKAMTPYTVPYEFRVTCDMSNKRFCAICPMQEANGSKDVTLTASDPAVLSLIGVTSQAQYAAIKALAKAVPQCNRPQLEIKSSVNIEELRLIPELDNSTGDGDTEYVSRQGFFLGHGLLPNRSYAMRGYSHPHPKTQATVHLLSEAEPAQDNISAFALTPGLRDELRMFQADGLVTDKFRDIYDDFAGSVHRILDRFDMQIAYDLVWHSAIGFYFNGAYVRRGWVEAMVMGDSGQGKTEMADNLLRHYGLGYRLPAEQTSMAGLIGGLEKMGDTWMLGWGAIPLNDKRLLIIDEAQGLASTAIEGMSDVRASGVAEITKIRTERTNARCRLIWLANPISGLTLSQHNQGVLAIKELFKKPEDIRRLDFAIAVASGDVDFARSINVRHAVSTEPRYRSDLCRSLVLWAWSRRADQIVFSSDATDRILAAATDMGRRYHSSIPLVEPSDQRLKLARLAVAAAARVYSTDESGEQLLVRAEHVSFVVDFLTRAYTAKGMAYTEYSEAMRRGEELTPDEAEDVRREIEGWTASAEAVEFLRTTSVFRKTDLVDGLGWDDIYAKMQLRFLQGKRLIRPTRTGYYKAPAFISLLRTMAGADAPLASSDSLPDFEGAPF